MSKVSFNLSTLTREAWGGLSWTVVGSGGEMLFRILSLIVFSRLLSPEEIGVAAAAILVAQLAQYVGEMGLVSAVIQSPQLSDSYCRTACTVMVCGGLLSSITLFFASPLIATTVFAMPELTGYLGVISSTLAVRGVSLPALAFAQRDLAFRGIAVVQLTSYAIGHLLLGVLAALAGFGAWSIVLGFVGQAIIETIGMVWLRHNQLRFGLNRSDALAMLRFGRSMVLAGVFNSVARQVDLVVIGRVLGPGALGVYTRAQRISGFPFGIFDRTAGRILLPAIARTAEKGNDLLPLVRRLLQIGVFLFVPLTVVLVVLADEIVVLLLGGQWMGVVAPLQVMFATFFFRFLYKFCSTFLTSVGLPNVIARLQFGYAVASIAAVGLLIRQGMLTVAVGISVVTILLGLAAFMALLKFTQLSARDFGVEFRALFIVGGFSTLVAVSTAYLCRVHCDYRIVTILSVLSTLCLALMMLIRMFPELLIGEGGERFVEAVDRHCSDTWLRVCRVASL